MGPHISDRCLDKQLPPGSGKGGSVTSGPPLSVGGKGTDTGGNGPDPAGKGAAPSRLEGLQALASLFVATVLTALWTIGWP